MVHFFWSQKKDIRLPLLYAAALGLIFAVKIVVARRGYGPRRAAQQ